MTEPGTEAYRVNEETSDNRAPYTRLGWVRIYILKIPSDKREISSSSVAQDVHWAGIGYGDSFEEVLSR